MLELDEILLRYLEERFVQSSPEDQQSFQQLLAVEDPVLNEWLLLDHADEAGDLAGIVERVRGG